MKRLINQLFTKEEIINRQHEQINERTLKIKGTHLRHIDIIIFG